MLVVWECGLLASQFMYLLFPSFARLCGCHLDSVDSEQQLLSCLLSRLPIVLISK